MNTKKVIVSELHVGNFITFYGVWYTIIALFPLEDEGKLSIHLTNQGGSKFEIQMNNLQIVEILLSVVNRKNKI